MRVVMVWVYIFVKKLQKIITVRFIFLASIKLDQNLLLDFWQKRLKKIKNLA
jgi:hypothetical protein